MGLFSSKYEAHGSVSANQVGVQRDESDTYYGDLLMLHPYNNKNFTDELLEDIKTGVTATYRKYKRTSEINGFHTKISLDKNTISSGELGIIKEYIPNAEDVNGRWGFVNGYSQAMVSISADSSLEYSILNSTYATATIKLGGQTKYIIKEYIGSNKNVFFDLSDDTTYDTGYTTTNKDIVGYFGIVTETIPNDNYHFNVKRKYYWMSTDERLKKDFNPQFALEAYACVSLQDNGNNEQPYYLLDKTNEQYVARDRTLKALGVDFEEMSKQIFDPDPIPPFGSEEWNRDFKPLYDGSKELQEQYGSETNYHNELAKEHQTMANNIKNITDVHFGMFISPAKLDIANAYALKGFFKEILPGLPEPKSVAPMGETAYKGISFDIASGSLKIRHSISGYKFGRRKGYAKDYAPEGVTMHSKNKGKICWGISETFQEESDKKIDPLDDYDNAVGPATQIPKLNQGVGGIFIATQSANDENGNPTYEFIEIYKPFARHYIDVLHDGDYGRQMAVNVEGTLEGFNNDDYSDVLLYPLTVKALKVVPVFKRERLMRETSMLIIDGIQVTKIKWYQKGIFKIIFTILAIVISCYIASCANLGALMAGDTTAWTALITFTLKALATGIALSLVLEHVKSPILAALIVAVAAIIGAGGLEKLNYTQMASLAVEATNTYVKKSMTMELLKLEHEAKENQRLYKDSAEQMDKIMEDAGMQTNVDSDWVLYKATLPTPGEYPEDFISRCLKRDFAIIKQDNDNYEAVITRLPNRRV